MLVRNFRSEREKRANARLTTPSPPCFISHAEHKATTDENDRSTFKYLHVTDTSHARRFHLSLRVAPTADSVVGPVFDSRPISIISKPSKKTNKARSSSRTSLLPPLPIPNPPLSPR